MPKDAKPAQKRIDQFFSGPGGRADNWRDLVDAAKAGAQDRGRAKYDAALADLSVTEEFHGYPGLHLMAALKEAAASGDAATSLSLATRITQALTTRSFRQHAGDWTIQSSVPWIGFPVGYAVSGILLTVFAYFAMLLAQ